MAGAVLYDLLYCLCIGWRNKAAIDVGPADTSAAVLRNSNGAAIIWWCPAGQSIPYNNVDDEGCGVNDGVVVHDDQNSRTMTMPSEPALPPPP